MCVIGAGAERRSQNGVFASLEEAQVETFNYFEVYYNRLRRQSGLNYQSPADYEKASVVQSDAVVKRKLDKEKKKSLEVKTHSSRTN